eukprot:403344671
MKKSIFITLTLSTLHLTQVSGQLLNDGKFCNVNDDCISTCCIDKKCQINNNCLALKAMDDFVKGLYCDINVQCDSKCCLFGECVDYDECFQRYDLPIILGLAAGIGLGFLLLLLAYLFTPRKRQLPPPPPPKIEEEIIMQDDLIGPIYYEGDDNQEPQMEDLQPIPLPVQDDKFEDNVEVGHYDEKTVNQARDYMNTAPRSAKNLEDMYNNSTPGGDGYSQQNQSHNNPNLTTDQPFIR